jgi:hypothetical protein
MTFSLLDSTVIGAGESGDPREGGFAGVGRESGIIDTIDTI